jgi:hypothetical protein
MMITSSTSNSLPEKSSSALDLISWIGRGNVLTTTVDMAPLSLRWMSGVLPEVLWEVFSLVLSEVLWEYCRCIAGR